MRKTELKRGFADLEGLVLVGLHRVEHDVGDALGHVRPDVDDLVVALGLGDDAVLGLLLDRLDLPARLGDLFLLDLRDVHVRDRDGEAGDGRVVVAHVLEVVQELDGAEVAELLVAALDEQRELLLALRLVDEAQLGRDDLVEEHAADGRAVLPLRRVLALALRQAFFDDLVEAAQLDARVQVDLAVLVRGHDFAGVGEHHALALLAGLLLRQVGDAEHHVVRRERRSAGPTRATGCCWRPSSGASLRAALPATAARGRPSGRRRSRR